MPTTTDPPLPDDVPAATGDPYIVPMAGPGFEFKGTTGAQYLFLGDGQARAAIRVAPTPVDATRTYVDQVTFSTGGLSLTLAALGLGLSLGLLGHYCRVRYDGAVLDGVPLAFGAAATTRGTLTARRYQRADGRRGVDLSCPGWALFVHQDPGAAPAHPPASPLFGVPHLGVYTRSAPAAGLSGLGWDGSATQDPARYAAMVT